MSEKKMNGDEYDELIKDKFKKMFEEKPDTYISVSRPDLNINKLNKIGLGRGLNNKASFVSLDYVYKILKEVGIDIYE